MGCYSFSQSNRGKAQSMSFKLMFGKKPWLIGWYWDLQYCTILYLIYAELWWLKVDVGSPLLPNISGGLAPAIQSTSSPHRLSYFFLGQDWLRSLILYFICSYVVSYLSHQCMNTNELIDWPCLSDQRRHIQMALRSGKAESTTCFRYGNTARQHQLYTLV